MKSGELTVSVKVDHDRSVCDMFDISESLERIVNMVPVYDRTHARRIKRSITDKMVSWLDAEAKDNS
jgi:hypothetical protein